MFTILLASFLIIANSINSAPAKQTEQTTQLTAVNVNGNKIVHKKPTATPTAAPTLTPTATLTPTPTPTLFVQVLSPNGGEILTRGQVYRITWDSSPRINTITLGYKACESCLGWIVNNIPNTGYYDWTVFVGNTVNTQFKIFISGGEIGVGSVSDLSDNTFTVLLPTPTPTRTPTPTNTPIPTRTPTPTPITNPLTITSAITHYCTEGSSCPYLTNLEVNGTGFAPDSRVSLKRIGTESIYYGRYVGGNGSTKILTDFYYLSNCAQFSVTVYGSTGTLTASEPISSLCP
jgi:hypothetical protein